MSNYIDLFLKREYNAIAEEIGKSGHKHWYGPNHYLYATKVENRWIVLYKVPTSRSVLVYLNLNATDWHQPTNTTGKKVDLAMQDYEPGADLYVDRIFPRSLYIKEDLITNTLPANMARVEAKYINWADFITPQGLKQPREYINRLIVACYMEENPQALLDPDTLLIILNRNGVCERKKKT
jgi:hypothetical protein